ncbi:MAG: 7-carboxy-7-deazaguanine synthase QueE [Muribaculaceae bacterium]|nr:7-carboxy-7-deazaguanine synthase QueE [Muribaculaceae bacterium]
MKTYPINEIFYSLQGEGAHSGQAATFVRFSGCNLKCPFCDTDHFSASPMTVDEIVAEVSRNRAPLVILTGGEPSLFVDAELVEALHAAGKYLAMETNGTNPVDDNIDWITMSPKFGMSPGGDDLRLQRANEIKVVYIGQDLGDYFDLPQCDETTKMYLQPCYVSDPKERRRNIEATINCVKADPRWVLSAQLHRYLGIR